MKHTEHYLLILAGRLAIAAEKVINSNMRDVSWHIDNMRTALDNYDRAIMDNTNSEE
jgi:hypothetical protein